MLIQSFRKIPGVIHPKPWDTAIRAAKVFAYPTVVLSVLAFTFLQYWWYAHFTPKRIHRS